MESAGFPPCWPALTQGMTSLERPGWRGRGSGMLSLPSARHFRWLRPARGGLDSESLAYFGLGRILFLNPKLPCTSSASCQGCGTLTVWRPGTLLKTQRWPYGYLLVSLVPSILHFVPRCWVDPLLATKPAPWHHNNSAISKALLCAARGGLRGPSS